MHLPGPKAISATFQRPAANNGSVRACQERSQESILKESTRQTLKQASTRQNKNDSRCQFFPKTVNSCCFCRNFCCFLFNTSHYTNASHSPTPPNTSTDIVLAGSRPMLWHYGGMAPQNFREKDFANLLHCLY